MYLVMEVGGDTLRGLLSAEGVIIREFNTHLNGLVMGFRWSSDGKYFCEQYN